MILGVTLMFITLMFSLIVFWVQRDSIPARIRRAEMRGHCAIDYRCVYWASDYSGPVYESDRCKICNPEEV